MGLRQSARGERPAERRVASTVEEDKCCFVGVGTGFVSVYEDEETRREQEGRRMESHAEFVVSKVHFLL